MKPASSAAEPVAPVDRLCSLMAMVVLLWEIDSPFPPSAIEADIDHGHAAAGAVLWELLWCRYEGDTGVASFDHVLGRDHKRQILD
jgi:hypothetical protein